MALDILTTDSHDKTEKLISLYADDYELIMEMIQDTDRFPLLKRAISDYYEQNEIYLNEINDLKSEILYLKEHLPLFCPDSVLDFMSDFLGLIEYAVLNRKTIKFIGD